MAAQVGSHTSNDRTYLGTVEPTRDRESSAVAYPELVSRGVSKSRKFKWLVKVGACKDVNPLIKKTWPGGVSGQPENPPGYATEVSTPLLVLYNKQLIFLNMFDEVIL